MLSTAKIDWFTGVAKYANAHPFPLATLDYTFATHKGWSGYDVGEREIDTDIKRYRSTTRPDMGFAIVASSGALNQLAKGGTSEDVLAAMWRDGFREYRASRLDLAIDVFDGGELAQKVARSARRKVIKTRARQISVIEGITGKQGITTYLGSRGSTRFMRVYDKNAESEGRVSASRFELQCNKAFAAEMWRSIGVPSQSALNTACWSSMQGFVQSWGDESVQKQLEFIVESKPSPKPKPADDAWEWISRQVLPTLQRDFYLSDGENATLLERLNKAIKRS